MPERHTSALPLNNHRPRQDRGNSLGVAVVSWQAVRVGEFIRVGQGMETPEGAFVAASVFPPLFLVQTIW